MFLPEEDNCCQKTTWMTGHGEGHQEYFCKKNEEIPVSGELIDSPNACNNTMYVINMKHNPELSPQPILAGLIEKNNRLQITANAKFTANW